MSAEDKLSSILKVIKAEIAKRSERHPMAPLINSFSITIDDSGFDITAGKSNPGLYGDFISRMNEPRIKSQMLDLTEGLQDDLPPGAFPMIITATVENFASSKLEFMTVEIDAAGMKVSKGQDWRKSIDTVSSRMVILDAAEHEDGPKSRYSVCRVERGSENSEEVAKVWATSMNAARNKAMMICDPRLAGHILNGEQLYVNEYHIDDASRIFVMEIGEPISTMIPSLDFVEPIGP